MISILYPIIFDTGGPFSCTVEPGKHAKTFVFQMFRIRGGIDRKGAS